MTRATATAPRMVLFLKSRRFKNEPGYALENNRWHRIERDGDAENGGGGSSRTHSAFVPSRHLAIAFRESLRRALESRKTIVAPIHIGNTPPVFGLLGADDLPMVIGRDVVRKAVNGVKHQVPMSVMESLPEILANPVMVFDSATERSSFVVLSEFDDSVGKPVIVALHLRKQQGRLVANVVSSAYGKDKIEFFAREIASGRLRYRQTQKSADWVRHRGLQLPGGGSPDRRSSWPQNVRTELDVVKSVAEVATKSWLRPGSSVLFLKSRRDRSC